MSEIVGHFDFMELGQAIMKAREQQRITREELAEELGISARHLQSIIQLQVQQFESKRQLFSFQNYLYDFCLT